MADSVALQLIFSLLICIASKLTKAEWNTQDFLKREHTLVKPYYGKFTKTVKMWFLNLRFEYRFWNRYS